MASKRNIRRKSCEGKIRYISVEAALHQILFLHKKSYTGRLNAYHCKFCSGVHVGHQKPMMTAA